MTQPLPPRVDPDAIKPTQHCTSDVCTLTFSHTAAWCHHPQPRQCDCHWCYPERGQL